MNIGEGAEREGEKSVPDRGVIWVKREDGSYEDQGYRKKDFDKLPRATKNRLKAEVPENLKIPEDIPCPCYTHLERTVQQCISETRDRIREKRLEYYECKEQLRSLCDYCPEFCSSQDMRSFVVSVTKLIRQVSKIEAETLRLESDLVKYGLQFR